MSLRQSRGYKTVLVLGSIVCLVGAGYVAYRTFVVKGGSEAELKKADLAYTRGAEAFTAGNYQDAAIRFDEAALSAENGLNRLGDDVKRNVPEAERVKNEGALNYIRARAIRDREYAKAKKDGKPLLETVDSSSGETYRSFLAIPDQSQMQLAIVALRKSFELMPENPEVIKDLTRVELLRQQYDWNVVEKLLRNTIKLNPKDARAHFFLAKFEFEQPSASNRWAVTPPDERDGERVRQAREHLEQAKANDSPYWRTVHLEADMLAWELKEAKSSKSKSGVDSTSRALIKLLLDSGGALERAARGEKFTTLSPLDVAGVFGVHLVAINFLTNWDGPEAEKVQRLKQATTSLIDTANRFCKTRTEEPNVASAGEAVVDGLLAARSTLITAEPTGWSRLLSDAQKFMSSHPKAGEQPLTALKMGSLSLSDAAVDQNRRGELEQEAIAQLEAGLKAAQEKKLSPAALAQFHEMLAKTKLLNNRPAEEIEGHVTELRSTAEPRWLATANFLEGVLAERQGKLEIARKLLEPVVLEKEVMNTPLAFQAVTRLANITMVTGDYPAAVGYLARMADAYASPQRLDPATRAWLEQAAANRDDVVALQVKATIMAGMQRLQRLKREQPNRPVPAEQVQSIVEAAERLAKPLRAPSVADRTARLAIASMYSEMNQTELADRAYASLVTDYPDSVDVLRAAIARMVPTVNGKKELDDTAKGRIDARIQQFLKLNTASRPAKLFWAEWLIRTRRNQEAADYLRDPRNFPDQDPVVSRLLAGALFGSGDREEARKILGGLSPNPVIDLALVQAAATKEDREKGLQSALNKYENNGLLRLYDAASKMNQGKLEEAVREFRGAKEYTQVKDAATAGLNRALIAFAGSDPVKAVPVIHEYLAETPNDPGLYTAASLGALYLDNIGQPTDQWGSKKTMYAAVNRWEQLAAKDGTPDTAIGLTKAQYHLYAGSPLLARQEALRVNSQHPNHVPTLVFLVESYLSTRELDQAKEYLERVNAEAKATDPTPALLEGLWLELKEDWDAAAKLYERMMTQYDKNPTPYVRRVAVATAQKKPGEALMWVNKWVEKMPDDPAAQLELVTQLAKSDPAADAAIKRADAYVNQQLNVAEEQLKAAKPAPSVESASKYRSLVRARALLQTATSFSRAKAYGEAKKRVNEVLAEIPDSPAALLLAGDVAMAEQNWDEAVKCYRRRLESEQKDFIAANNLAWILAEKKNTPDEALKLVTTIRSARGGKPIDAQRLPADFLDTIGSVYLKLNDKSKFAEMKETFEGAVTRYPTDPRMHCFLGQAYTALGETAKALVSLRTAIRLASDPNVKTVSDAQKDATKQSAEEALKKVDN